MSYAAAHRARVMLLYRRALKTVLDWSGDRRQWYGRARAVRNDFEANRVTVRSARSRCSLPPPLPPRTRPCQRQTGLRGALPRAAYVRTAPTLLVLAADARAQLNPQQNK